MKLVFLVAVIQLFGKANAASGKADNREWVVGYEKVDEDCKPVGGLTTPGVLPFRYATVDDCVADKEADSYDSKLKLWKGYILEQDVCVKVSGRARFNPFQLDEGGCEAEKKKLGSALAVIDGSGRMKRGIEDYSTQIHTGVQTLIVAASLIVPKAALLAPIIGMLWPSNNPSVWEQSRAKVHELVNQKLNEAYAKELENYLDDLKREIEFVASLKDKSRIKLSKLVAIDSILASMSNRFMNEKDPISTLTYFIPYVTLRFTVQMELIRLAHGKNTKKMYAQKVVDTANKYINVLRPLGNGGFYDWRIKKNVHFALDKTSIFIHMMSYTTYKCIYSDKITGVWKKEDMGNNKSTATKCVNMIKAYLDPLKKEVNAYQDSLKKTVGDWETLRNDMAAGPILKGKGRKRSFLGFQPLTEDDQFDELERLIE